MPSTIDYAGKSERDLLIELVGQGNSSVQQGGQILQRLNRLNGTVASNCHSIDLLDIQMKERTVPAWMGSKSKVAGLGAAALTVATTIVTITMEILNRYTGG